MKKEEFRAWLASSHSLKATTNRVSRAGRVERGLEALELSYRDLDDAYGADGLKSVLAALRGWALRAKAGEMPPQPLVRTSTEPGKQMLSLMNAIQNYRRFCGGQAGSSGESWLELETMRIAFLERIPDFEHFEQREGTYWEDERAYKEDMLEKAAAAVSSAKSDMEVGRAVYDALLPGSGPPLRWQTIDAVRKINAGLAEEFDSVLGRLARSSAPIVSAVAAAVRELEDLRVRGLTPLSKGEILAIAFSVAAATRPRESAFFRISKALDAVKRLGEGPSFTDETTDPAEVAAWLNLLQRIFEIMRDEWRWRPRDLLDVQGFLWVVLDKGWAADDEEDEPSFLLLYDANRSEYEPARQLNRASDVSAFRIKPEGASNETTDAVETDSLLDVARALLINGRPVRVRAIGASVANYLTYGPDKKLQGYRLSDDLADALGVPTTGGVVGEEAGDQTKDADRIRKFVLDEYITPARQAGARDVTVLVREINERLGLNQAWPNICQVLEGKKFHALARVAPPKRIGAPQSSATQFCFALDRENIVQPNPTNLILYGPPGTGKTYQTAAEAVRLCDDLGERDSLLNDPTRRKDLRDRYDQLVDAGQIRVVTFHQSYSYEEFVEGLRPVTGNEAAEETGASGPGFRLAPKRGIFREICAVAEEARKNAGRGGGFNLAGRKVFKMSLGRAVAEDHIFDAAIEGGYAALGWGGNVDWSDPKFEDWSAILERWRKEKPDATGNDPNVVQMWPFRSAMKPRDLVIVSAGNSHFRAIGEVTGPYRFEPTGVETYNHRRAVRWLLVPDEALPVEMIYGKNFMMQSCYQLKDALLKKEALARLLPGGEPARGRIDQFVIVIDEINRANVSKVFGELITLIEPDKRLGTGLEQLVIKLPYSGDTFGVPSNLHIIGTMNTADRSIALLDTALRRRFEFRELMPDPALLPEQLDNVPLRAMLRTINERVEYLFDREHQIGHAFFVCCSTQADVDRAMRNKVIPLLQEYFYEDWEKVAQVLGDAAAAEGEGRFIVREKLHPPKSLRADEEDAPERWRWRVRASFAADAYRQFV